MSARLKDHTRAVVLFVAVSLCLAGCGKEKDEAAAGGYYTCSMHPQVIQQQPGLCPICNMKLVYQSSDQGNTAGHSHSDGQTAGQNGEAEVGGMPLSQSGADEQSEKTMSFKVSATMMANANIATSAVVQSDFERRSVFSGHLDFSEDPGRLVIVNTKYDGWIEKLFITKEGQYVKAGQNLLGIYSPEILSAKEEYLTTFKALSQMNAAAGKAPDEVYKDANLQAARKKLLFFDMSMGQIHQMEKDGEASRLTWFFAPISGVVVEKKVLQGQFIKAGQEVGRIANLSRLWAFVHIFEKDIPFVQKGQKVELKTSAYPAEKFKGTVDLIYPFLDMKTKDIKVRIVVNNFQGKLKPGMFAEIEIAQKLDGKKLVVPDKSVVYSGRKSYVFVSLGEGRFEVRPVVVLTESAGRAVIASGVVENDLVVTNGQFLLDSEASLKEALGQGSQPAGQ